MKPPLDVWFIESELRFRTEDGWTEELVFSCLDQGELYYDSRGYFRLSLQVIPASFSPERLSDLTARLLDHKGRVILPRERRAIFKYYSQHGVFLTGDDALYKLKHRPLGRRTHHGED